MQRLDQPLCRARNITLSDVQEVENAFKVFGVGISEVVTVGRNGGVASPAVVWSDDGVALRQNWTNSIPGELAFSQRICRASLGCNDADTVLKVPVHQKYRWPRSSVAEMDANIFHGDSLVGPVIERKYCGRCPPG